VVKWGKACRACGTHNKPEEGHVNTDDLLTLKYRCSKCHTSYTARHRLNEIRVDELQGMSMKDQANKGGRTRTYPS